VKSGMRVTSKDDDDDDDDRADDDDYDDGKVFKDLSFPALKPKTTPKGAFAVK